MTRTLWLALLLLGGCASEVLHHDLDESEANEIVYLLHSGEISAHKAREAGAATFAVEVASADLPAAIRLLEASSLPRPKFRGVEALVDQQPLLRSPAEERALEAKALSAELSRHLLMIEGVVGVSAIVALPPQDDGLVREGRQRASVSVVLRARPSVDGRAFPSEAELKRLVAASIPGVDVGPENVAVLVQPARPPRPELAPASELTSVLGIQVAVHSARALQTLLFALALVVLGLCAGACWLALARSREGGVA